MIYLSDFLSICLSIYLSTYLPIYLSICLTVYLSICVGICLKLGSMWQHRSFLSLLGQKVLRDPRFLILLTCKCASRHSGVHFFDVKFKSGPNPVVFNTFDLQMCVTQGVHLTVVTVLCNGALHVLTSKCASRHNSV